MPRSPRLCRSSDRHRLRRAATTRLISAAPTTPRVNPRRCPPPPTQPPRATVAVAPHQPTGAPSRHHARRCARELRAAVDSHRGDDYRPPPPRRLSHYILALARSGHRVGRSFSGDSARLDPPSRRHPRRHLYHILFYLFYFKTKELFIYNSTKSKITLPRVIYSICPATASDDEYLHDAAS